MDKYPHISLLYKGQEGDQILRSFQKYLKRVLPINILPRFVYTGKKLGSHFSIKDRVPMEHKTDLIYAFKDNLHADGNFNYIGETNVRYETRVKEHCSTDTCSSVFKYKENLEIDISLSNFSILDTGYSNRLDRRIAEALFIREHKPALNGQQLSVKLQLFN